MKKKIIGGGLLLIIIFTLVCRIIYKDEFYFVRKPLTIEKVKIDRDKDNDGILDMDDIIEGARNEVENKTEYKSVYYDGGYPPDSEGVCTDVVWRALKNAGYNLKYEMDEDIKKHTGDYASVAGKPDPNIDFRRVKNQYVYFQKYAQTLTTDIIPNQVNNLIQWQGGDIVVLKNCEHIAIVSDKRRRDGIPYIIHNANTIPKEEDKLFTWYNSGKLLAHFRYPK